MALDKLRRSGCKIITRCWVITESRFQPPDVPGGDGFAGFDDAAGSAGGVTNGKRIVIRRLRGSSGFPGFRS